ncbi:GNAT family N-acetyltransferase [Pelomonas sp. KK5]|uniref:GNAT family N-acetyltransferase n=1 Tax=Pelomonas sp. KK5 TaxID=1855730 RepID=UPI00097C13FB|nr:GNAT family N-acetyltransferase [Pelomonas sp. KK5]
MKIRPATQADFPSVLALNEESVRFLSPMSAERLVELDTQAAVHQVVEEGGQVVAFLLAFREGARYDSINYRWFADRYARFLYVDRVVVSGRLQAKGAGTRLYEHVFAHAAEAEVPLVVCEFDVEPPNPVSERFHARFGFREVGRQVVAGGAKVVSLQAAPAQRQLGE